MSKIQTYYREQYKAGIDVLIKRILGTTDEEEN